MQSIDITNASEKIKGQLNSIKTFVDVSKSEKQLKKSAGNSSQQSDGFISTQLNKISEQQKRFQRNQPTSTDQLMDFIGITNGSGSQTLRYIRKKLLEVAIKIEPEAQNILQQQALKVLGCSQEQTYEGIDPMQLSINPLPTLPIQQGIYIPVQSLDLFSNLKNSPESKVGKVYYEKDQPSSDTKFKPYGGKLSFPMNKQLFQLMDSQNANRSFSQINGKNYQGRSLQNLFDVQYTKSNEFGVSGDFFRVIMIDREVTNNLKPNTVGTFLKDYYSTINLVDPVDFGAQLVNLLSGAVDIKSQVGFGTLDNKSKFSLLVQRVLGLCFDSRREIDVSGISKVAELDGVDESFFEFNEIDLRNIDIEITNIQNGVTEFVDCENVKLPINTEVLIDELINFRDSLSSQTESQKVETIEKIIDSISQNPSWNALVPANVNLGLTIDKNVIKKIPLALVSGILTPKVLLPIYVLLSVVQNKSSTTYNSAITSANTFVSSAQTASDSVNNVVTTPMDFIKKFKSFNIEVISQVNAIFLRTLFEILKKDIVNLLSIVINDISNSKTLKKYALILKLVNLALIVAKGISDYRRCKSLLDEILLLLNLINGFTKGLNTVPLPLLALSPLLPGFSPERSSINVIGLLQSVGVPTGALPDGSPNLMLLYNLATNRGINTEMSNIKIEGISPAGPVTGVII